MSFLADSSPDAHERVVDRLLASPLWRALGAPMARPRALCRYQRLREGQPARHLEVPRLGDQRLQSRPALRPVHRRTDRRGHAPEPDGRAEGRHRLPSQCDDQRGRWRRSRSRLQVSWTARTRPRPSGSAARSRARSATTTKHDPFTQKDYFRLLSFFANNDYDGRSFGDGAPPSSDHSISPRPSRARARRVQAEIDRLDQQLKTPTPELRGPGRWEESLRAGQAAWTPLTPQEATATNGAILRVQLTARCSLPARIHRCPTVTATSKVADYRPSDRNTA